MLKTHLYLTKFTYVLNRLQKNLNIKKHVRDTIIKVNGWNRATVSSRMKTIHTQDVCYKRLQKLA